MNEIKLHCTSERCCCRVHRAGYSGTDEDGERLIYSKLSFFSSSSFIYTLLRSFMPSCRLFLRIVLNTNQTLHRPTSNTTPSIPTKKKKKKNQSTIAKQSRSELVYSIHKIITSCTPSSFN